MKLGTETGSVINHLLSRATNGQPEPEVGMGCTLLQWSDRQAGTIIAIENGILTVQEDHATRTDNNGMSEDQEYEYAPNPMGATHHFRFGKSDKWDAVQKNERTGRWNKSESGAGLMIGQRRQYRDFSF